MSKHQPALSPGDTNTSTLSLSSGFTSEVEYVAKTCLGLLLCRMSADWLVTSRDTHLSFTTSFYFYCKTGGWLRVDRERVSKTVKEKKGSQSWKCEIYNLRNWFNMWRNFFFSLVNTLSVVFDYFSLFLASPKKEVDSYDTYAKLKFRIKTNYLLGTHKDRKKCDVSELVCSTA